MRAAGGRLSIRWSLFLATACALALIVYLRKHQPSYDEKFAPLPVPGTLGTPAVSRNFEVTVKRLKLARSYRIDGRSGDGPSRVVKPDGIWLSALVDVNATEEPGYVSAQLRTRDGRTYTASGADRPDLKGVNLGDMQLITAIPATGGYFFDVPEDSLEGATLEFRWGLGAQVHVDHVLVIDPELDAAAVAGLREAAVPELDLRTRTDP